MNSAYLHDAAWIYVWS